MRQKLTLKDRRNGANQPHQTQLNLLNGSSQNLILSPPRRAAIALQIVFNGRMRQPRLGDYSLLFLKLMMFLKFIRSDKASLRGILTKNPVSPIHPLQHNSR
jgi:hypothetical protein